MSIPPANVIRVTPPTGGLHGLAENRDHTTGAGLLTAQDMSVTTSGRLGVWMGYSLVAGFPADHGEVADEAAMITLHDWDDDAHERAQYHYVAPGDSCTRADDPGYRWVCLGNHGYSLADWERRPLGATVSDLRTDVDAMEIELAGKIGSSALEGYAHIDSPALTGTPTAPTPGVGTNSTRIATTAYVVAQIAASGAGSTESWRSGLTMWLDAAYARTTADALPADGAATVATILDQSGNGISPAQTSSGLRPTYRAAAINGLPAVEFVRTAYTALTAQIFRWDWISPTEMEVLAVFRRLTTAGSALFAWLPGGFTWLLTPYQDGTCYYEWVDNSGRLSSTHPALTTSLDWMVIGARRERHANVISVNGTDVATSAAPAYITQTTANSGQFALGAAPSNVEYGNNQTAEMLIWRRALTSAERSARVAALRAKYAI